MKQGQTCVIVFLRRHVDDANDAELDMGFTLFRKSTPSLLWQFAKMKMGFNLNETRKPRASGISSAPVAFHR
jgi:hypothetical protein